jgi:DNA polymerase-3 subunit epsilon
MFKTIRYKDNLSNLNGEKVFILHCASNKPEKNSIYLKINHLTSKMKTNMLNLTRPVAFIDLETTGVSLSTDRIVEIAIIKILPDGSRQVKRKLINPEMNIPKESSDIHGITDEMVKDAPTFKQAGNEIKMFIENCDLGGYNSNRFDIPILMEEFLRSGMDVDLSTRKMIDVQHIFYTMEPRTLTAAYKFFCEKELVNAHSAEADVDATIEVLMAQLNRYKNLGNSVDSILSVIGEDKVVDYARRFAFNDKGVEIFNFGKHKGRPVRDVLKAEPQYYDWMMRGDFPLHTKQKLTEILNSTLLKNN